MKDKTTRPTPISTLIFSDERSRINLGPSYQRESVWTKSQKQLLIDSLLRGIDIPKLYFRVFNNSEKTYEVVDGQQRLRTILDYYRDMFELDDDFDDINGDPISSRKFSQLSVDLQHQFRSVVLDIVELSGYTDDDIEEMFLRLQNGTPLNSAEKRRAIHSSLRDIVAKLAEHDIFVKCCGFTNKRYSFEDSIAKIVHFHLNDKITDIKPVSIKKTYEQNKNIKPDSKVIKEIERSLNFINKSFAEININPKLKKNSILTLTYLTTHLLNTYNVNQYRQEFAKAYCRFEEDRIVNSELSEEKQDPVLAAYTDASRSDSIPNMTYRHDVLLQHFIKSIPNLETKDPIRDFTTEQRTAIYLRDDGICQICKIHCSQEDFHADHIIAYTKGGKTKITNGQVTCSQCNHSKGSK